MNRDESNPERRRRNQPKIDAIGAELGLGIGKVYADRGPSRAYRPANIPGLTQYEQLHYGLAQAMDDNIDSVLLRWCHDPQMRPRLDRLDQLLETHREDDRVTEGRAGAGRRRTTYRNAATYFSQAFEVQAALISEVAAAAPLVLARHGEVALSPSKLHHAVANSPVLTQLAAACSVNAHLVLPALRVNPITGEATASLHPDRLTIKILEGRPVLGFNQPLHTLRLGPNVTLGDLLADQRMSGLDHRRCPGAMRVGGNRERAIPAVLPVAVSAACREPFWPADLSPGGRLEQAGYHLAPTVDTTSVNLNDLVATNSVVQCL